VEEITGIPAPKTQIPYWVALAAAQVNECAAFFTGKPPDAAGGRAHGQIQNVVQSDPGDSCVPVAANAPDRRSPMPSSGSAQTGM